jgi:amino acid adenylation domain-containing protein
MNVTDLYCLAPATTRSVLYDSGHGGAHRITWLRRGARMAALYVPQYKGDAEKLDARLRRAHGALIAPIAYWLGSCMSPEVLEAMDRGEEVLGDDTVGWVVIDPNPVPSAHESAVAGEMAAAFATPVMSRDQSFLEAGGHSLGALALRARLQQRFGVELRYDEVHTLGTARLLAAWVDRARRLATTHSTRPARAPVATLPASEAQGLVYAAAQGHPSAVAYNVPIVLDIDRRFDTATIREALVELVRRHSALRASFSVEDGRLQQRIHSDARVPFISRRVDTDHLHDAMIGFRQRFDFARGPLLRACLFDAGQPHRTLLIDFHHLVVDGISVQLLLRELRALLNGDVLEPPTDYAEALSELEERCDGELASAAAEHWARLAATPLKTPRLQGMPEPSVPAGTGDCVCMEVPASLVSAAQSLAVRSGTSLHCVFLAGFNLLLAKLLNEEDIVIGVPCAGRSVGASSNAVGMFAKTLPARHVVRGDDSFATLLNDVAKQHLCRMEYQALPAQWQWAEGERAGFSIVFATQRFDFDLGQCGRWRPFYYPEAHFQLLAYLVEHKGSFELHLEYDRSRIDGRTVETCGRCLLSLMQRLTEDPNLPMRAVALLSSQEEAQFRRRLSLQLQPNSISGSVVSRWTEAASRWPAAIALEDETGSMTYAEVDAQSTFAASVLRRLGVVPGDAVGLLSERRAEYVVALLAILKCGAAYVPLDPSYPTARLSFMVEASACRLCITLEDPVPALGTTILRWDEMLAAPAPSTSLPSAMQVCADDVAYVMFTSGSTGRPKGVKVNHRNIVRLVCSENCVPLDSHTRVLLTGSPSFDATTYEIWGPLLNGGSLAIASKATLLDAPLLRRAMDRHRPTVMWLTAPLFARHVECDPALFSGVQHLIVGGDVVPASAVKRVQAHSPDVTLVNGYGPTENTTFSTFHVIAAGHDGPVPVGTALERSSAYVLDAGMNLLPPGALGELYVGGEGVCAGYLDATADVGRFIVHCWPDGRTERLYRTGDLARADHDGTFHLFGRCDTQIKVRGYRVEPEEVREVLCQHEGIAAAHVAYLKTPDCEGLVAYLVTEGAALDTGRLLEHLHVRLPVHMVPTLYCVVDSIELNANGKVAQDALPRTVLPLQGQRSQSVPQAMSAAEHVVAGVWRELLQVDRIDADSDFFHLGGDSLKLVSLAARLEPHHGKRPPVPALYAARTVRAQAGAFVQAASAVGAAAIPLPSGSNAGERFRANDAQSRLFLLDRVSGGKAPYLIPVLLRLDGDVDEDRLSEAWQSLVARHPFLRSRFVEEDGVLWVDVLPAGQQLLKSDLGNHQLDDALSARVRNFSLARGDVVRAEWLRSPHCSWLAMMFHHVAFDGASIDVLLNEFAALYRGEALGPCALDAGDLWRARAALPISAESTAYWVERLAGAAREVQLPADRVRSAQATYEGATLHADVDADLRQAVKQAARRHGVTPYMVWLGAFLVVMQRYARQDDLTIGTVSAGRTETGSEGVVGMLANTLPLRFTLDRSASFAALLEHVTATVLEGVEHQAFSLERVITELSGSRESWRNPLFNVLFSMVPAGTLPPLGDRLHWQRADWTYPTAKFDLSLFVLEEPHRCRIAVEYANDALAPDSARRLMTHYLNAMRALLRAPDEPIGEASLLDAGERHQVLQGFNDTQKAFARHLLMHQPFEARAASAPDALALVDAARQLSYRELDQSGNRLAHLLRQHGCDAGVPVMIMMDRSAAMIVAVLAVHKAGGYYVPVDPAYPAQRIASIARTLDIRLLVTDRRSLSERGTALSCAVTMDVAVCVDGAPATPADLAGRWFDDTDIAAQPAHRPELDTTPDDPAYTIFTSGSTGQPKGVEVCHRPAINLIEWVNSTYRIGASDKLLFVTSLCFDLSVYDIFGMLAAGGAIRIAEQADIRDPRRLLAILRDEGITFWDSAPAALQQVVHAAAQANAPVSANLRLAFLSGDWVPVTLPGALRALFPNCEVVALGGATEATVWSNYYDVREDCERWVSIPYGKPIQNARYYVLDDALEPCPVGVPGRLYIGGECLALGYARQPELTAARFIDDPFVGKAGGRMYDTGDLARWRADGNLVFLGRQDHQVKIRGYRVELGEVTHCLMRHPAVEHALVLAQPDTSGTLALVAHVVARQPVDASELTGFIAMDLPAYMIPQWFSFLAQLPATANGKFDRDRLPRIADLVGRQSVPDTAMSSEESRVHAMWCDVLGLLSVGIDTSFHAAGGDSLRIVHLHAAFEGAWPGLFSIPELFSVATVRAQAARVAAAHAVRAARDDTTDGLDALMERVSRKEIDIDQAMRLLSLSTDGVRDA